MKIATLFLILSAILFVSGITNLVYTSYILLEKYPDLQVIYAGELEGGQQVTTQINVTEGEHLTISILAGSKNPLFFYIEDVKQDVIVENIFSEKMSFPLSVNQSGIHTIGVGNMGDTSVQIDNYISKNPILDTEFVKGLSNNSLISYLLIFVAIVLFLIGLVLYFIKKIIKSPKRN